MWRPLAIRRPFWKESDAAKIKTIFWAFNITNFAPQLNIHATVNGTNASIVGTWFNKNLKLSTGETTVVGVEGHAFVVAA